jgi:hypothetical protein
MLRRSVRRTMTVAATALLVLPGVAGAGGFATVGLSALPDGSAPGKPWNVTLTILQHGRTPLSDLQPTVIVRSADGNTTRTFKARPAAKAGTYTAAVVFPSAGRWRYSINDGFSQTHSFAPVEIGSSRAVAVPGSQSGAGPSGANGPVRTGDDSGGNVGAALGAGLAAGLLAALATALFLRRRGAGGGAVGTPAAPR